MGTVVSKQGFRIQANLKINPSPKNEPEEPPFDELNAKERKDYIDYYISLYIDSFYLFYGYNTITK